jgi:transposase InsO family protein
MDLITDLPESRTADGTICDCILSVVDHGLTKGVILIPTTKISDHTLIGRLLHDNLFKRFSLPESIISDRDPRFAAQAFRELQKLVGVHQKFSTAFHPQTDGTTERFNQEIKAFLSIYCANNPTTWASKLAMAEFVHNNRRHADRTKTPFELIMGTTPLAYPGTFHNTKFPSVEERLKMLEKDRKEAQAAQELAMQRMAQRMNSTFAPFQEGQKVLLSTKHLAV